MMRLLQICQVVCSEFSTLRMKFASKAEPSCTTETSGLLLVQAKLVTGNRLFSLLLVACLASACSGSNPSANLSYKRLSREQATSVVEFNADLDIDALYAKNRYQKDIRKFLRCALSDDQNFDVEHKMRYVFEGSLKLQGSSRAQDKATYRYLSHGDFYENPPNNNDLDLLRREKLADVLGGKKLVPCKVIMTVYMSSPYYSGTMFIPTSRKTRIQGVDVGRSRSCTTVVERTIHKGRQTGRDPDGGRPAG